MSNEQHLNDILSEIYKSSGIDEKSSEVIDYWVIDKTFVCEPYLGGLQLGELPDFNITGSHVLNITQEDFDRLMNEHFKLYGSWPDT